MEQAISMECLTFHLLSKASSSIVSNAGSKREPACSLLNSRAPWALQTGCLNNVNVVSLPAVSRLQCHLGKQPCHLENTQAKAARLSSVTCGVCPSLLQHELLSPTLAKSIRDAAESTHLGAIESPTHLPAPPTELLITPLTLVPALEAQ